MQINFNTNIQQTKPNFQARYRIPTPSTEVITQLREGGFKLYEKVKRKPVTMFENGEFLDVFTGKDAKLFNDTFSKGVVKQNLYKKIFKKEDFKPMKNIYELNYKMLQEEYHH